MALTPTVYEHLGDSDVTEFECSDCKIWVIAFGSYFVKLPPRCGTCQWVADIEDPVAREQVRKHLADLQ